MSSRVAFSLGAMVATVALARGQAVWPATYAATRGNAVMNAPFTVATGSAHSTTRCMVVLDPASMPFAAGAVLSRLSFRRDSSYPNQGYAATTGHLLIRMGPAIAAPEGIQDVRFSRIFAAPPTVVANVYSFTIPAAAAPGSSVPPFSIVVPFSRQYTWQGGPLAIDIVFTPAGGSSAWRLDAFAVNRPQTGSSRQVGLGCVGSNGFAPWHYALPETTMPGTGLVVQMEGGRLPASSSAMERFAFHLLGVQNTTFQGSPLPRSLSAFGGPAACMLRVAPLATFTVATSNPSAQYTRATNTITLPANAALVGSVLYSQWLVPDSGQSTALPVVASDAQAITLGQLPPTPRPLLGRTIWKYGADGYDAESGRMVPDGYAPILRFN